MAMGRVGNEARDNGALGATTGVATERVVMGTGRRSAGQLGAGQQDARHRGAGRQQDVWPRSARLRGNGARNGARSNEVHDSEARGNGAARRAATGHPATRRMGLDILLKP